MMTLLVRVIIDILYNTTGLIIAIEYIYSTFREFPQIPHASQNADILKYYFKGKISPPIRFLFHLE